MIPIPNAPQFFEAQWSCLCPTLTPAQVLSACASSLINESIQVISSPFCLEVRTDALSVFVNLFRWSSDCHLVEFQRRTGDREMSRLLIHSMFRGLQIIQPQLQLCLPNSQLSVRPLSVVDIIQDDGFAQPILGGSPSCKGMEVSGDFIETLLSSAASPALDVHREALVCLAELSSNPQTVNRLRRITERIVPVLCDRLKSRDAAVCALTAKIGVNVFAHLSTVLGLSTMEQTSLCHALIGNIEDGSPSSGMALEDLYDVVKSTFGIKLSPTICT
uniref:Uncharacterized protein n=1 Tax=Spongospora subterranea TaxID=70186 RepID=A0A0H5R4F2_9EUKA|eukprot:CRZ09085.1 hypothetical protein [Spongospora subterranea]